MENGQLRTTSSKMEADAEVMGPEELVRRETRAVNFLRALVIVVFIIVGGLLSLGSYKFGSKWEEEAYRRSFSAISSHLTSTFISVISQTMWHAFTLGAVVSASTDLSRNAPNITIPLFDKLSAGAVQSSRSSRVFWAPLIQNSSERLMWEAYANSERNTSAASNTSDQCFPCGDEHLTIGALDNHATTPFGTYTCSQLDWAAKKGLIAKKDCPLLTSYVLSDCECVPLQQNSTQSTWSSKPRSNQIYEVNGTNVQPVNGPGPYSPLWQVNPTKNEWVMYDLFTYSTTSEALDAMLRTQATIISKISDEGEDSPRSSSQVGGIFLSPVLSQGDDVSKVIGTVGFSFDWSTFLAATIPLGSKGIMIVLENSCGQQHTFKITGDTVEAVGKGDLHDPDYSSMMKQSSYADYSRLQRYAAPFGTGKTSLKNCYYRISVYPSPEFHANFVSNKPRIYATVVILIFAFACLVFFVYDCYVAARQRKVMKAALQRDEIVSSLFPAEVQERLFQRNQSNHAEASNLRSNMMQVVQPNRRRRSSSADMGTDRLSHKADPIADLFPSVTVVFADISGFTAWSSEREPSQVFQLLETVYQAFDELAKRMGVFKLETIGDCYVAAAGIPVYQPDHAALIVQFAYECLLQMHMLTHELEATLGPSTSALSIRIGVHSGPVIAGVLRGEKSRFQLFGDTMNTTSRMQSTSEINRIQISRSTADLLESAGKSHWVTPRDEQVAMKGKGLVQTYWADPSINTVEADDIAETRNDLVSTRSEMALYPWGHPEKLERLIQRSSTGDKMKRLVEWNTDLLLRLIRKIVAARQPVKKCRASQSLPPSVTYSTPLEECTEILPMKAFPLNAAKREVDPDSVDLGETVRCQLQEYISEIASLYKDHPFHNFEHASHVAMSAAKVVKRIIKPDVGYSRDAFTNHKGRLSLKRTIHQSTFGISSDVVMQFAVVFSAIIHDVDHPGVSNVRLVAENNELAGRYNNKCVAEQNSVDIAWRILMQDQYKELLHCICVGDEELKRFRQLLVNAVIATDIADGELQQERRNRWECAFNDSCSAEQHFPSDAKATNDMDRKATIVFEYIIQASDVAHTMQHWSVYKQWNERLFEERYLAYQCGRDDQDPSIGWFEAEIGFFDNYIIPLAKKLETCGVFGVSSDEYLRYALENRHEWELKGKGIVRAMVEKYSGANTCETNVVVAIPSKQHDTYRIVVP